MKAWSVVAAIGGGALALALALAGYIIAGIPGEIVGLLLSVPLAIVFGIYTGSRT